MKEANETAMMFASDEENNADKAVFVANLGWLLSQTRDGVESCRLVNPDTVRIYYKCGAHKDVNIHADSYGAIIRDVAKQYQ